MSRDWKGASLPGNDLTHNSRPLNEVVRLATWPTPLSNDAKGSDYTYGRGNKETVCLKLGGAAKLAGPLRRTASGQILTGSSVVTERGALLNPEHSRWLQGYPAAWSQPAEGSSS